MDDWQGSFFMANDSALLGSYDLLVKSQYIIENENLKNSNLHTNFLN
ncbi:hypothetical protein ABDH48_07235 [Geobacillus stearothermophilus]